MELWHRHGEPPLATQWVEGVLFQIATGLISIPEIMKYALGCISGAPETVSYLAADIQHAGCHPEFPSCRVDTKSAHSLLSLDGQQGNLYRNLFIMY